jgi:2-methylcitrate dehydratase PrpD
MDLQETLTRHVLDTEFNDLPNEAIAAAKRSLLDTLGTWLAGSSLPEYAVLLELIQGMGGKGESTLIPWGDRVPFLNAVLVNATLARARDIDAVHPATGIHPNATIIPTALGLAEFMGGISGGDFLAAVVLGTDVFCRMRMADNKTAGLNGWSSDTYNPFGATFTAGRLLKLSAKEMEGALGLAYAQAAGGYQIFEPPGYTALHQGLGARAGAMAGLLAQRGMMGPYDSFEGRFGFYPQYLQGDYSPLKALAHLGKDFEGARLAFKAYPCCLFTHGPVETAKKILRDNPIEISGIDHITVKTNRSAINLCCEPLAEKRQPPTRRSAMFSIPYVLANYLVKRKVWFEDFENPVDPEVLQMASRIYPEIDLALDGLGDSAAPTVMEIVLASGEKLSARVDYIKGHPKNPMDYAECVAKFKQCASYSAMPLTDRRLEEVIVLIDHLEDVEDVRSIIDILMLGK